MTDKHDKWIDDTLPLYEALTQSIEPLIRSLLVKNKIDHLGVTGRTKTRQGVLEKIERKKYSDPGTQLTDAAGIRIITFFESDVERVSELIREVFKVDENNSLDKSAVLGVDQIGYRSVHFVCELV